MKRFSSISVGIETLFGLLKLVVKAVALAVSLNAGKVGITGFEEEPLLYSKIAVVVALSNFLVHLHKLVQLCSIELVVGEGLWFVRDENGEGSDFVRKLMNVITNEGTTNLVNNRATSSGSSFMNLDNDGKFASNTLIGIVESDSEVEVVFDETANLRISTSGKDGSDKGYGTNSLLEQWKDSYPDNDDYDPYDDDMYENQDLSKHL
ncbi:hypothetical protein Tco_0841601 [Tanacetum coccineum]|uniref:Uncharacterized protein n=1 Tax=Tanacetum coccineum TaxID=301880 RepID=A0ABQ5B187_9ASTR